MQKNEQWAVLEAALNQKMLERDYSAMIVIANELLSIKKKDRKTLEFLAGAYIESGDAENAARIVKILLGFHKKYPFAHFLQARVAYMRQDFKTTIGLLQEVIIKDAQNLSDEVKSLIYNLLGNCWKEAGEPKKCVNSYKKAIIPALGIVNHALDYSNYLFNINYLPNLTKTEIYQAHIGYSQIFKNVERYSHQSLKKKAKIKIGYISPDFRHHVVSFFSYQLLAKYNKSAFAVTCYARGKEDAVTAQMKGLVDCWHNISGMHDDAVAALIYQEEIDILVDLSGHTQHNCLPILARKPAPIQICGIGYFNTTGLDTVDYFLTDSSCDPIGLNEDFFIEEFIRLPHSHFCYTPPDAMPDCAPAPWRKTGRITFGSFNNFTKTTDEILLLWREILERVPNSKLLLKSKVFGNPYGQKMVEKRLFSLGLQLERIEFRPETYAYLEEYRDVDIALDTFPYPGGGTTCDALYMGVPVITLAGERHGSRFGYSILKNIGLEELAANTAEEYVDKAVGLAGDKELLDLLHKNLRNIMRQSPLMNGKQYLKDIETAYRMIWEKRFL